MPSLSFELLNDPGGSYLTEKLEPRAVRLAAQGSSKPVFF